MADAAETGTREAEATKAEIDETRQSLLRVCSIGAGAYLFFLPMDLYSRATNFPDVSPWWCVFWRLLGSVLILGTWFFVRASPRAGAARLMIAGGVAMAGSLACLGALSVPLGGLTSSYLFSPAFYAVGISTMVPTRWRTSLALALPALLLFTGAIVVGVGLHPTYKAQFDDSAVVASFVQGILRISGVVGFAIVSGHVLWRARVRLRDAYRLGRYLLKQPIGQGGMNEVWLAWDSHLKREVALKLLHVHHPDDSRRKRFEREARATSGLHSPHTVRIYDYGQSGRATFWIAMEFLRGSDLEKMVQAHGPLPPARALHLARQAAASLAEAHHNGIVHRDIKPANLFALSAPEQADFVKVLDFGIARQRDSTEASLTMIGMVVGTPAFMAPEVLAGSQAEPASDVWSFGATLYTLLTATLPYEYSAPARGGTGRTRLVPPSERLGVSLPPELDAFVMGCMHPDPTQRPADGAALVEALRKLPIAPWTADEAKAWWANHTRTRDETKPEGEGAAIAPTEVSPATVQDAARRAPSAT